MVTKDLIINKQTRSTALDKKTTPSKRTLKKEEKFPLL